MHDIFSEDASLHETPSPLKRTVSPLDSLLRLGNFFELAPYVKWAEVDRQLERFSDHWVQYNPYKPNNPRQGLSITSLDGGLTGKPDLFSLREYYRREGTLYRESDFRTLTEVYAGCPAIHPLISHYLPYVGRTHFLRFGEGGYFPPHRDSVHMDEPDTFRLIVPLKNTTSANFVFSHEDRRLFLSMGNVYFLNTMLPHSVFSFKNDATMLICNIILNEETVRRTKAILKEM